MADPRKKPKQLGAALIEYAIALLLVILTMAPVMIYLTISASVRANSSIQTVKEVSPCTSTLKALTAGGEYEQDACN